MDNKKAKRLSKEEIKTKLVDSMTIDEIVEFDDLNKEAEKIEIFEKAIEIIKRYEHIIKTKNKGIINVAYHQAQVFKRFKEKEKSAKLISELGIHKTTIIFRINILKLCKNHPKLLNSSTGLGFFKNYHKDIKAICEENEKDFQCLVFLSFKTKFVTQIFIRDMKVFICIHFHF